MVCGCSSAAAASQPQPQRPRRASSSTGGGCRGFPRCVFRRRVQLTFDAVAVQLDHEGHERTEVASKSVLYRIMSALLPTQVMWGWVTSQKGRGKRGDEVLTEELVKERRRRLFRSLSRSLRSDEFLLLFNLLDKVRCRKGTATPLPRSHGGRTRCAFAGQEQAHIANRVRAPAVRYLWILLQEGAQRLRLRLVDTVAERAVLEMAPGWTLLRAAVVLVHAANPARSSQEDGYDPTKCSMSMERFRQFYDAIRLERRGVHPRLVGDLFDYVDFTVGTAIAYASVCMTWVFTWCVDY